MISGVGVDIVEIERIKKAVQKYGKSFLQKVYTSSEILYCQMLKSYRFPELAVRFAAKEAYAKALGTGIGKVSWRDIEVVNNKSGKPLIALKGKVNKKVHVSLSHSREQAIAMVVLEQ
ncbi:MAG: holo-ACP synthase [Candidatus Margulisbacteria bacterium]|jgi:holo-[acyl-carrier protein] synthase|nr:holo-ACP synthase [Candidatus Margulisiibacteriota bacterium]